MGGADADDAGTWLRQFWCWVVVVACWRCSLYDVGWCNYLVVVVVVVQDVTV